MIGLTTMINPMVKLNEDPEIWALTECRGVIRVIHESEPLKKMGPHPEFTSVRAMINPTVEIGCRPHQQRSQRLNRSGLRPLTHWAPQKHTDSNASATLVGPTPHLPSFHLNYKS